MRMPTRREAWLFAGVGAVGEIFLGLLLLLALVTSTIPHALLLTLIGPLLYTLFFFFWGLFRGPRAR